MNVELREFLPNDYQPAMALWQRTPGIGLNESDERESLLRFLKRNPGLSRVATVGEELAGTVLCGHDGRRGYLYHLAVDPRWQRRGIATALTSAALEGLRTDGILKCTVFLFATNAIGRAFWQSQGWRERADLTMLQAILC